ncbi:MAG: cyclomaltodextrinase N-terminal domain-containing protein, partial [Spirosomataceae bacterium]
MKKISNHFRIAVLLAVMPLLLHAQETTELKINPTNWYVGMKNPNIQLLVYGDKVGNGRVKLKEYGGVKITRISTVENPNYVFIDLVISPNAKA